MRDARKYSVPFAAAIMRDLTSSMPSRSNSTVCASGPEHACETGGGVEGGGSARSATRRRGSDGRWGTHRVISDEVNARDLLEALDDHSQEGTTKVLRASACENVPKRGSILAKMRFGCDGLSDAPVGLLHLRVGVGLPIQRGDDRQGFGVTSVLSKPSWRLRQLRC